VQKYRQKVIIFIKFNSQMKIIHLSDPHIEPDILHGINSQLRFKKALEHIKKNHLDSDLFVISGDITHFGSDEAYKIFLNIIKEEDLPKKLLPRLIIGNHDNRENFKKNFTTIKTDENGFIQYTETFENKLFIFLDTNKPETDSGYFCEHRQRWFEKELEKGIDKSIYIFMHHNPLALADENSDKIGLVQKDKFEEIILKYNKNIRHLFFGHQHITVSGQYLGITFSSPRSTWSPLISNFSNKYRLGTANTDPNYNIVLIKENSLVVHSEDFLKTEVNWFESE